MERELAGGAFPKEPSWQLLFSTLTPSCCCCSLFSFATAALSLSLGGTCPPILPQTAPAQQSKKCWASFFSSFIFFVPSTPPKTRIPPPPCASSPPPPPLKKKKKQTKACCSKATEPEIAALFTKWNDKLKTQDPDQIVPLYAEKSVLLPTLSNTPR